MAFSVKDRLEKCELQAGEDSLIQRFAADNAARNPQDLVADALDVAANKEPSHLQAQTVVDNPFRSKWRSYYEDIPVYECSGFWSRLRRQDDG